ncbi:MAG: cytochrome ubiquinol oxidase subunit I, partial [Stackebrandtia sp.]
MDASTLDLARLQFALTAGAHFLFVALTLGLATFVALIQTRATFSRDPMHLRMVRFWGQLYVINYAVGIVTGIVMEFQFGMNWSGLSHFAGNTFGATLALETVIAFFIEATFLGLWIFGWGRLNRWAHLATIWVVTLTAYASAYFILVTNGFLQDPAGFTRDGESLRLTDPAALLTNPNAIVAFLHIVGGALLTGAFFMAGVAAYHLFRHTHEHRMFVTSLRIGVFTALPATLFTATFGGIQFAVVGGNQPMKMAVFDGTPAKVAQEQAAAVARYGPGDYVPPEMWVRLGGILMLVAFGLMMYLAIGNVVLALFRKVVLRFRLWHLLLI